MRLLSLLIFTVFLTTGSQATFGEIWGRFTESGETTKLCLIRQAPIRIFQGLAIEYGRRTDNFTVIRQLASLEGQFVIPLYENLTTVTTWRESAMITLDTLRRANEAFQAIYTANPGIWNPEFPSLAGIYKNNTKARIQEAYDDLGRCYSEKIPCQWSDFGCKFRWFISGGSVEEDEAS